MIQLFKPALDVESCLKQLRIPLTTGWLGRGPLVEEFEQRLAQMVGAKHFVATSSCTAALHLAIHCLDLPRGSRVAVPPITFVASVAPLLWEGLVPVFCDVERWTGLLDCRFLPDDIDAVVAVHLGGSAVDLTHVAPGIPIVEDCAHALGSSLPPARGPRCWSFHAVKNLPLGDGGGVSTNDDSLAERLHRLRWMGITKDTHSRVAGGYDWEYSIPELGWKYAMNDLQAAIGLAQLPWLKVHNERRQHIAGRYAREVEGVGAMKTGQFYPLLSSCHFHPLFFEDRERVRARCKEAGIETGVHYQSIQSFRPFVESEGDCPWAEWYEDHELTLPLHPGLSERDVDFIISVVNDEKWT